MDSIKTLEGDLQVRELRFAILASRFNDFIVEQLVRGAVDMLKRHGASEVVMGEHEIAKAMIAAVPPAEG